MPKVFIDLKKFFDTKEFFFDLIWGFSMTNDICKPFMGSEVSPEELFRQRACNCSHDDVQRTNYWNNVDSFYRRSPTECVLSGSESEIPGKCQIRLNKNTDFGYHRLHDGAIQICERWKYGLLHQPCHKLNRSIAEKHKEFFIVFSSSGFK